MKNNYIFLNEKILGRKVALVYILQVSLMSGSLEDRGSRILHIMLSEH